MNYDISFRVKVEGVDAWVDVGECSANITWNARKIIELSTGIPWNNEANNGLVKDIIHSIEKGLCELINNPEKYKPYESPNHWGTVEGTKHFFAQILIDWDEFTHWHEKLVDVVTFWIV